MTKEEIIYAIENRIRVRGNIAGVLVSGCIKEIGYLQIKAGPGYIQRAVATIVNDDNLEVYCHIKDIEKVNFV
ncbi:MAG: hypothetical protein PVI90_00655 [Desulfobacteraceae bacterium]|jgi:hypothetical protein